MNFNNYICSVIALSLINLSNFWGAVHEAECGVSQPHQKSFGDAIVSLLYGIAHEDLRVAPQYAPRGKESPSRLRRR